MIFYSFYYYSLLSVHPYVSFPFLFFFSLVFSPSHMYPHPHPHSSHFVFIFLDSSLSTQNVLYFYFSFFISSSLFLILSLSLSLSPYHTHINGGEQSLNLKLALPKRRVSEERELRDVPWREKKKKHKDMLCFSRDGSGRHDVLFFFLLRGSCVSVFLWKGICVSFSFVFLCSFFFF